MRGARLQRVCTFEHQRHIGISDHSVETFARVIRVKCQPRCTRFPHTEHRRHAGLTAPTVDGHDLAGLNALLLQSASDSIARLIERAVGDRNSAFDERGTSVILFHLFSKQAKQVWLRAVIDRLATACA